MKDYLLGQNVEHHHPALGIHHRHLSADGGWTFCRSDVEGWVGHEMARVRSKGLVLSVEGGWEVTPQHEKANRVLYRSRPLPEYRRRKATLCIGNVILRCREREEWQHLQVEGAPCSSTPTPTTHTHEFNGSHPGDDTCLFSVYRHGAAHHRRGGLDEFHRKGVIYEHLKH